ncbi:MAG TPA: hypothetical protein VJ810_13940 [Blastocatellia bacterium]|nr:hypothetical protein [Blastocatellia bacterium]
MNLNASSKMVAVAALAAIAIFYPMTAKRASALPTCPSCRNLLFSFGMLGITAGQTARLNVVNAIPVGPPQRVTLMFADANGRPFINAGGQLSSSSVILGPGQSAYLDLNGDAIPIGPPNIPGGPPSIPVGPPIRVQFRALIPNCDGCNHGLLVPTLEVFDNASGKTTLVMPDTPAITKGERDE